MAGPRVLHYLRDAEKRAELNKDRIQDFESGRPSETAIRTAEMAGQFRVMRLCDLADRSWFESRYYKRFYRSLGYHDAIWAGVPINEDAEAHFGLYRADGTAPFSKPDCLTVHHALRGLRWFHRQQMLAAGVGVASEPLTPLETRVLGGLLGGLSDKVIAAELEQSPHTVREYVRRIYRKYGVSSRTSLMALWLGRG